MSITNVVAATCWPLKKPHGRHVHRYGIVSPTDWQDNHFTINGMVEKPKRDAAPSNLIISGRYILQPEIFAEIEKQEPGTGGEIQITDAMIRLMATQPFHGLKYKGTTYDCGDKIGFLSANVAFALGTRNTGPCFPVGAGTEPLQPTAAFCAGKPHQACLIF